MNRSRPLVSSNREKNQELRAKAFRNIKRLFLVIATRNPHQQRYLVTLHSFLLYFLVSSVHLYSSNKNPKYCDLGFQPMTCPIWACSGNHASAWIVETRNGQRQMLRLAMRFKMIFGLQNRTIKQLIHLLIICWIFLIIIECYVPTS